MAGIWSRTDDTRGVWKAPANEVVRGALDVEMNITKGEQSLLNYWPTSPMAETASVFGELVLDGGGGAAAHVAVGVFALYDLWEREGAAFVPKYLRLLSSGGRDRPEALLAELGLDVRDPAFWSRGLAVVTRMVDDLTAGA